MNLAELETTINAAWDDRDGVSPATTGNIGTFVAL